MPEWIKLEDQMPEDGEIIIYSIDKYLGTSVGRYCGKDDPMPSIPRWMRWEDVKYWFPLDELDYEAGLERYRKSMAKVEERKKRTLQKTGE